MALIVIVDDRLTNRTIYSKLAQSIGEGVKVRAFGDPGEALEWLQRNRPDLIVTDYDMPKIAGDEFISRFRDLPHSAGVPIMMITVNDQRTLRLRALESGATDFLNTPIDHFEFLSRARNLLKLSQRRDEPSSTGKTRGASRQLASPKVGVSAPSISEPGISESALAADTRKLLAQCGQSAPYALHVVEIDAANGQAFDAAALAELLAASVARRRSAWPDRSPAIAGVAAKRRQSGRRAGLRPPPHRLRRCGSGRRAARGKRVAEGWRRLAGNSRRGLPARGFRPRPQTRRRTGAGRRLAFHAPHRPSDGRSQRRAIFARLRAGGGRRSRGPARRSRQRAPPALRPSPASAQPAPAHRRRDQRRLESRRGVAPGEKPRPAGLARPPALRARSARRAAARR